METSCRASSVTSISDLRHSLWLYPKTSWDTIDTSKWKMSLLKWPLWDKYHLLYCSASPNLDKLKLNCPRNTLTARNLHTHRTAIISPTSCMLHDMSLIFWYFMLFVFQNGNHNLLFVSLMIASLSFIYVFTCWQIWTISVNRSINIDNSMKTKQHDPLFYRDVYLAL